MKDVKEMSREEKIAEIIVLFAFLEKQQQDRVYHHIVTLPKAPSA